MTIMFKKTDFEKAKADLDSAEGIIERALARVSDIDRSIEESKSKLQAVDEQLGIKMYTDAPIAELEGASRTNSEERAKLESWIAQQVAIRARLEHDVAVAKLRIPHLEKRIEDAQCDWFNMAVANAEKAAWSALMPVLGPLVRLSRLRRAVLNIRRQRTWEAPLPLQKFEDIWSDCYDGVRKAALAEGLDLETTHAATTNASAKNEPPATEIRSTHLTSIDRHVLRDVTVGRGMTPEAFLHDVAARIEASKPKLPPRSECHERVAEWSEKIRTLEAQLAYSTNATPAAPQSGWKSGDLKDERRYTPDEIAGLKYRLDQARTALKNWQASLAEHQRAAAA